MHPALIPELDVTSIETSKTFYVELCGFAVEYERPQEQFAMLSNGAAFLMLEEATGAGRRFHSHLERPFGRGVNFQIRVDDVDEIHNRLEAQGHELLIPLEERWYRSDDVELGNRQFVVADPDGYLLRFFSELGSRPTSEGQGLKS